MHIQLPFQAYQPLKGDQKLQEMQNFQFHLKSHVVKGRHLSDYCHFTVCRSCVQKVIYTFRGIEINIVLELILESSRDYQKYLLEKSRIFVLDLFISRNFHPLRFQSVLECSRLFQIVLDSNFFLELHFNGVGAHKIRKHQ